MFFVSSQSGGVKSLRAGGGGVKKLKKFRTGGLPIWEGLFLLWGGGREGGGGRGQYPITCHVAELAKVMP